MCSLVLPTYLYYMLMNTQFDYYALTFEVCSRCPAGRGSGKVRCCPSTACDEASTLFAQSVSFCAAPTCSMEVCIYMSATMYAIYMCVCVYGINVFSIRISNILTVVGSLCAHILS